MASFVFLTGVSAKLTGTLTSSAGSLPLSNSDFNKICCHLTGEGDYSYMTIDNGYETEQVKVTCVSGAVLIERGSPPIGALEGACVYFTVDETVVKQCVEDALANHTCKCEDGGATEGGTDEETGEGTNEDSDKSPVEIKVGKYIYTFDGSGNCPTKSLNPNAIVKPGEYTNATVTIDSDGCVTCVEEGSNVVYSTTPTCGCGCCKQTEEEN